MAAEGLDLETDGEWVWAKNTSLGADDGIAVAMIFAVLAEDTLAHPPIEVLLTVDEETGMDGAFAADLSDLKGKQLLNLDSEEEGVFTVSCAGGIHVDCFLHGTPQSVCEEAQYRICLSGLLGGHSGTEIDKGRANANVVMGRVLLAAAEKIPNLRLSDLHGGRFHNVICPLCEALVALPSEEQVLFDSILTETATALKNEYAGRDDGLQLRWEPVQCPDAMDAETSLRMIRTLAAMPQGVLDMNVDFPGLVQTSVNLGVVRMDGTGLHFTMSIRSCIASRKQMVVSRILGILALAGGRGEVNSGYPGWQYKRDSVLQRRVMDAYRTVTGKEGVISATHGGLECGLLLEKRPELDAVSMGPDLTDIHSFHERLNVASTQRVYRMLCEILKQSR